MLGPGLKLDFTMFLVNDLFLNRNDIFLRVRLEIEKNSNSEPFEQIADLKVLVNIGMTGF